jgi:hypothetical protein
VTKTELFPVIDAHDQQTTANATCTEWTQKANIRANRRRHILFGLVTTTTTTRVDPLLVLQDTTKSALTRRRARPSTKSRQRTYFIPSGKKKTRADRLCGRLISSSANLDSHEGSAHRTPFSEQAISRGTASSLNGTAACTCCHGSCHGQHLFFRGHHLV